MGLPAPQFSTEDVRRADLDYHGYKISLCFNPDTGFYEPLCVSSDTANFMTATNTNLLGVIARLDTQIAELSTVHADLSTVHADLGTVNTTIGASNTALGSVNTNLAATNAAIGATNTALATGNTNTAATVTALATNHADLVTIEGLITASNVQLNAINANTDTLESLLGTANGKLDTLHADNVAMLAAMPPSTGLSLYASALSLLGSATIKSSAGSIYSITTSGALSFQNGAGNTIAYAPAGTNIVYWSPIVFSTDIRVSAIAAANITIQFR